ncbi:MAG: hypothetical protein [Microviridae sp.]|nr:MAG: hypothetical protein [Microviridae sp.]
MVRRTGGPIFTLYCLECRSRIVSSSKSLRQVRRSTVRRYCPICGRTVSFLLVMSHSSRQGMLRGMLLKSGLALMLRSTTCALILARARLFSWCRSSAACRMVAAVVRRSTAVLVRVSTGSLRRK